MLLIFTTNIIIEMFSTKITYRTEWCLIFHTLKRVPLKWYYNSTAHLYYNFRQAHRKEKYRKGKQSKMNKVSKTNKWNYKVFYCFNLSAVSKNTFLFVLVMNWLQWHQCLQRGRLVIPECKQKRRHSRGRLARPKWCHLGGS